MPRSKGEKGSWWHDKEIARIFGGRPSPRSGGIQGFIGDVTGVDDYAIECKYSNRGVRLSFDYVYNFMKKSTLHGKKGLLVIQIEDFVRVVSMEKLSDVDVSVNTKTILFDRKFLENTSFSWNGVTFSIKELVEYVHR